MTQEEKAKAYDEAIDKVAHFIKKHIGFGCIIHPNSSEAKELFNIFPELKESEDERIRKDIIWCLKHSGIKESNPINPHVTTITKDAIAWLEKQGKNNMGISEATKQKLEDNLNKALEKETRESWNEFLDKQGEQKSAWSEEDEHIINLTIHHLSTYERIGSVKKCISWLKSLKDRYTWKPSDEQMDALNDVISSRDIKYDVLSELWKDLKKLREE